MEHLEELLALDLWVVTAVRDGTQTVVAAAGAWAPAAPPGTVHPWQDSFCLRMVGRRGPVVAPDVAAVPAYAEVAVGPLAAVRAYVGVPLEDDDGVFGTLCGFAGEAQDASWDGSLGSVRLVGRMLSTIRAREQDGYARSQEVAAVQALVERDPVTGLRNRRGWDAAVEQEDTRCQRYGALASVLVLELDRAAASSEEIVRCAEVLAGSCRPGDVLARLSDREFAVLALECDLVAARALHTRLRVQLRTTGLAAATGVATRRAGERLSEAWTRAAAEVERERRRRTRR